MRMMQAPIIIALLFAAPWASVSGDQGKAGYHPGRLIVLPQRDGEGNCGWPDVQKYGLKYKMRGLQSSKHCGVGVVEVDRSSRKTATQCLKELQDAKEFEDAHLDFRVSVLDDQLTLSSLRPAQNQDVQALAADIEALSPARPDDFAWNEQWSVRQIRGDFTIGLGTEGLGVVVAVVDSGCNVNHPDLKGNLWTNDAEVNGEDGVDDDGNGFVDDKYGYNFVDDDDDLSDPTGHGTHVGSVIGATTNNNEGIAGLAENVKIMCLKFLGEDGSGSVSDAIQAIAYAVEMKAHIENHSWGGPGVAQGLARAIQAAGEFGQLHIAAAGNENLNVDLPENMFMPAGLANPSTYPETAPYMVSVAATDINDELAYFSNYGAESVDIAAPGVNIVGLSSKITDSNNGIAVYSGTSQATPHVTATAAMVLSVLAARPAAGVYNEDEELNPEVVKQVLTSTVDQVVSLGPLMRSGGRLNAFSAVQFAITGDPNAIRDVADTNPILIWAWILLTLVVVASFFACIVAWIFASAWQSPFGPPVKDPLI